MFHQPADQRQGERTVHPVAVRARQHHVGQNPGAESGLALDPQIVEKGDACTHSRHKHSSVLHFVELNQNLTKYILPALTTKRLRYFPTCHFLFGKTSSSITQPETLTQMLHRYRKQSLKNPHFGGRFEKSDLRGCERGNEMPQLLEKYTLQKNLWTYGCGQKQTIYTK